MSLSGVRLAEAPKANSFRCSTAGSRRWMASTIRDTRTIVCCSETNHPYVDRGDRCAGRERRDRADDPMGWRRSYVAAGEEEPSRPASLDYRRRRSRARHGARPSASRQGDCGDSQPRRQGDRSRQRMDSFARLLAAQSSRDTALSRWVSRSPLPSRRPQTRNNSRRYSFARRPPDTSVGLWCKPAPRPSISPCCQASEARPRPCSVPGQVLCL